MNKKKWKQGWNWYPDVEWNALKMDFQLTESVYLGGNKHPVWSGKKTKGEKMAKNQHSVNLRAHPQANWPQLESNAKDLRCPFFLQDFI